MRGLREGVSCFMASKNGPNSQIKVSCLRVFDHTPPIEGDEGLNLGRWTEPSLRGVVSSSRL